MGGVYGGANLTIAACLASSVENGFFHPSADRRIHISEKLRFNFCGQQFGGIRMRIRHDSRDRAGSEPLSTRGWTLQEKLLTTRLLSFLSGVTIKRAQGSSCECGEGLCPNPFVTDLPKK